MALWSSSIVLTSDGVDALRGTDSPTARCPLLAGDPRSDAGADDCLPCLCRLLDDDEAPPPLPRA